MNTAQKYPLKWAGIAFLISTVLLSSGCFFGNPNHQGGHGHKQGGYNDPASTSTQGRRTLPR